MAESPSRPKPGISRDGARHQLGVGGLDQAGGASRPTERLAALLEDRGIHPERGEQIHRARPSDEPGDARISRAGEPLHIEPKALRVLEVLIENAGALVERDRLIDAVWRDVVVTPGTLTRLIAELRRP